MLGSTLTTYADATQVVEARQLDYTLIRPAWFQDEADLVEKLIQDPEQLIGESVDVSKPNTDGPAPRWYR
jgi:hypothetical protein